MNDWIAMSPLQQAELVNVVVLAAILAFDFGKRRRIWWFRIVEPLTVAGAIVPFFIRAPAWSGNGALAELVGVIAGVVVGAAALALMRVYRSPATGRLVTAAGFGYVLLWVCVLGARGLFSFAASEWFPQQLGSWLFESHISIAAFTDSMILMAIVPLITRTIGLGIRAGYLHVQRRASDAAESAMIHV
jgi:hypothetical protein